MDKKNTTIGIIFLGSALALMVLGPMLSEQPQPLPVEQPARETGSTPMGPPPATSIGQATTAQPLPDPASLPAGVSGGIVPAGTNSLYAAVTEPRPDEQLVTLSNEFIDVSFTPYGGAIAEVALKARNARDELEYASHPDSFDPYVINARRVAPALSLLDFPGADRATRYELISKTATTIVWRATFPGQLEVVRTYSIQPDERSGEPYLIRHETTFRNIGSTPVSTPALAFNFGVAEPTSMADIVALNIAACRGKDVEFAGLGAFEGSGWFGRMMGRNEPAKAVVELETSDINWASAKNQFFTVILIPEKPSGRVEARRVVLNGGVNAPIGVTGTWIRDPLALAAGQLESVALEFYAGPKEYTRLNRLDREQYRLMEWDTPFTFIGIFSAMIFKLLDFLHGMLAGSNWAWGWSIVLTTVIIRSMMWPITAQAAKSAKRMGKIQAPLKAIQEKYKDNRAKQQEETIKLFKEHKINPVGGCLPLLFQIPIFIGLFNLLRSSSELRFAEFFWIQDLSAADTIWIIPGLGLPLNPMPLLMGITMFIQMRMTPTPTMDNSTAKVMKFMPVIVTVMCYGFSSGLALYWTASNCFSVFQQWVTNKRADPVDTAAVAPAKPGAVERAKPVRDAKVKNIPKKKK